MWIYLIFVECRRGRSGIWISYGLRWYSVGSFRPLLGHFQKDRRRCGHSSRNGRGRIQVRSLMELNLMIWSSVVERCIDCWRVGWYRAQRDFLQLASTCKAPAMEEMVKVLAPTSEAIQSVQSFREKKRTSPHFNHLSAISESIPALGWVTIVTISTSLFTIWICKRLLIKISMISQSPAPGPYVKEMNDAGQFYTNRVLKDFKEKYKILFNFLHDPFNHNSFFFYLIGIRRMWNGSERGSKSSSSCRPSSRNTTRPV